MQSRNAALITLSFFFLSHSEQIKAAQMSSNIFLIAQINHKSENDLGFANDMKKKKKYQVDIFTTVFVSLLNELLQK